MSAFDQGFSFAGALYGLVHQCGPGELTAAEREALASHLVSSAVLWVQARNAARQAEERGRNHVQPSPGMNKESP